MKKVIVGIITLSVCSYGGLQGFSLLNTPEVRKKLIENKVPAKIRLQEEISSEGMHGRLKHLLVRTHTTETQAILCD